MAGCQRALLREGVGAGDDFAGPAGVEDRIAGVEVAGVRVCWRGWGVVGHREEEAAEFEGWGGFGGFWFLFSFWGWRGGLWDFGLGGL